MLWYLTSSLESRFSVSKRPSHWSRKETPWVRSHRCSPHPCVPSTPGLEAIITNFASKQTQPCDRLVHAQSISQDLNKKKRSVKRLPNSLLDPKKGLRQSRICIQVFNCCSSISTSSNLDVRELYRKDCFTNPCRSKTITNFGWGDHIDSLGFASWVEKVSLVVFALQCLEQMVSTAYLVGGRYSVFDNSVKSTWDADLKV